MERVQRTIVGEHDRVRMRGRVRSAATNCCIECIYSPIIMNNLARASQNQIHRRKRCVLFSGAPVDGDRDCDVGFDSFKSGAALKAK